MTRPPPDSFWIDEEPLRKSILKGYFGDRVAPLEPEPLLALLRDLLSGPPPADCEPATYRFEDDPETLVPAFLRGIEREEPGLAGLVAEPLLSAAEEMKSGQRSEIAPNVGVFITSIAGSIAVKSEVSEATAAALLGGFLITVARLGPKRTRVLYEAAMAAPGGS